jgi:hypothetical protein
VRDILLCVDKYLFTAPPSLPGPHIHIGSPDRRVNHILLTPEVVSPPSGGPDLVLCLQPILPETLSALDESQPEVALACALIRQGVAVALLGSRFEAAKGGASDCLASAIGLQNPAPLLQQEAPPKYEALYKLVVFTPPEAVQNVINALASAGAGVIGNYSHCTFRSPGTGTFLPLEGAAPYIGEVGRLEQAEEFRLEVLVPAHALEDAVSAMLAAHPYEEVAYDIYLLANRGQPLGSGRIGSLPGEETLGNLASRLDAKAIHGREDQTVRRIAVVAGEAEREHIALAAREADCAVVGDVSRPAAYCAAAANLPVVELGYRESVLPGLEAVAQVLRRIPDLEVSVSPR